MEQGSYVLQDGTRLEAGSFQTQETESFEIVNFMRPFKTAPVVVASVTSFVESDAVTGRIRKVNVNRFEYQLQEQELNIKSHSMETISYIAWEPSTGVLNDLAFEISKTGNTVTNNPHTIVFDQDFSTAPIFLADMQTRDGGDTANIRWQNKDAYAVDVIISEEQSANSEMNHITEVVGYFAITPVETAQ
jgi:hypothetical protein